METIKNVLFVAFFMLGATVFAQKNVGPTQYRPDFSCQKPNKGIMDQLNLSDEQQAKLNDIRKEYHQKDSVAFAEFRNQQEQENIEQLKDIKSVLNKEQKEKYEDLLKKNHNKSKGLNNKQGQKTQTIPMQQY